ncbi:MAG: hypothetical protein LC111_06925 [Bacteroidia bacterium]|nr:hypothetical protein [Bacteroidia bacterium]
MPALQKIKRACKLRTGSAQTSIMFEPFWSMTGVRASYNSTYKKLAVQLLNEALCFVSSAVLADSFVLRNRQLLVAANRQTV